MQTPITAIFSDYDGTLCSTKSVGSKENIIPAKLELILRDISKNIPVCIISSKDYHFLYPRTRFANILSCIMGIETITLEPHIKKGKKASENNGRRENNKECDETRFIKDRFLLRNEKALQINSRLLASLADKLTLTFKEVRLERKFTSDGQILAGLTIDYRHLEDWRSCKTKLEPLLKRMIHENQASNPATGPYNIHIQTYSSHPFIDIYATQCDKGLAFDYLAHKISSIERKRAQKILYLGDSENDNPAFVKADVPISVKSDDRLNPKLSTNMFIKFDELPIFLKRLKQSKFVFSNSTLHSDQLKSYYN